MKNQKIEDYENTQKSKISQLKDLGIKQNTRKIL
jgi:hypothetical protein